jgi:hypothetical protein
MVVRVEGPDELALVLRIAGVVVEELAEDWQRKRANLQEKNCE